jgi:hypothetical protein
VSPELIGVFIGVIFVVPTIYLARKNKLESWAWPLFLTTLPVWYMLFGVLAMDSATVLNELIYGLPYILTGLVAWRIKTPLTHVVLAIAWLSHGLYDYYHAYHDFLFVNAGVFSRDISIGKLQTVRAPEQERTQRAYQTLIMSG